LVREAALDDVNGIVDPEKLAALALATVGTAIAGAVAFVGLGGRTNNTPTNSQPTDIVTPARRRKDGEEGPLDILVEGVTDLGRMVSDWWNDTPAINPLVASKADAALVAAAVYSDVPMEKKLELLGKSENPFKILGPDDFSGTLLEKLTLVDHEVTGLDSMLVKRTMIIDGQQRTVYVYALAGTEKGLFSQDGGANASAIVGNSSQYKLALDNAKKIQKYLNDNYPDAILLTTGHSLGGGMAASISLQTGIPAITFNPAGTNFLTNGVENAFNTGWNQIDAYITPTDPLNAAQRLLFPLIGANGRTHSEAILTPSGIFNGHTIDNFVDHYFPSATVETVNAPELRNISHEMDTSGGFNQPVETIVVTNENKFERLVSSSASLETAPFELAKKMNSLSESDKRSLYSDSLKASEGKPGFIKVEGAAPVVLWVKDTPASVKLTTDSHKIPLVDSFRKAASDAVGDFERSHKLDVNSPEHISVREKYDTSKANLSDLNTKRTVLESDRKSLQSQIDLHVKAYSELCSKQGLDENSKKYALGEFDKKIKELSAEFSAKDKELNKLNKDITVSSKKVESEYSKMVKANEVLYNRKEALNTAKSLLENKTVAGQLDGNFKKAVDQLVEAENKHREILELSVNDPTHGSKYQKDLDKAVSDLEKAKKDLDKYQSALQEINQALKKANGSLADATSGIKKITLKDAITSDVPSTTKPVQLPVYQNPETGQIRIGGGVDAVSFVTSSSPDGALYQGGWNPESEKLANDIRALTGVDVSAQEIKDKWCQAASLWTTLRQDFGDAVEPNFLDFVKKHYDAGNIQIRPGEVMYVNANDTIMNSYANAFGKTWERNTFSETFPGITRDGAYSAIADVLSTTSSDAVMVRVSETHTISLHRQGDSWIVKDSGHNDVNGTIFDPNRYEQSALYKYKLYENKIPESIAYAKG